MVAGGEGDGGVGGASPEVVEGGGCHALGAERLRMDTQVTGLAISEVPL